VEGQLGGLGLEVRRHTFQFRGRSFPNVAGVIPGSDSYALRVLVGACRDSVRGTPRADDNASGVAGMRAAARRGPSQRGHRAGGLQPRGTPGLDLPGGQSQLGRAGTGVRYRGALIISMIGYRTREAGSQVIPWMGLPRVVSLHSLLRGWLVWATRCSDNASFWSNGYPALLLTDTGNLRNSHYHRLSDHVETLDLGFATEVTAAACARGLDSRGSRQP
jgi:hypothetical protein